MQLAPSDPPREASHARPAANLPYGAADRAVERTHWTRILYHDVMNGNADEAIRGRPASAPDERRTQRQRSPLVQGAVLIGIYVAMHLGVAAVLQVLPRLDGREHPTIRSHWARIHPAPDA